MAASLHNPFRVEQIIGPATQGSRCTATLGYLVKALRNRSRAAAAPGGQSHFRGGQVNSSGNVPHAAKIGTVPCERLQALRAIRKTS